MKKVGINIDGVLRDYVSSFDSQYRKVFIYDENNIHDNNINPDTGEAFDLGEELISEEQKREERLKEIKQKEFELITLPVDTDDLTNHYRFEPKKIETNQFLEDEIKSDKPIVMSPQEVFEDFVFEQRPYQIFARAGEYKSAADMVNRLQAYGKKEGNFEVVLFSTVKGKAIPATYEFLSTHHVRARHVMFLESDDEKWDHCDILIDATPQAIQSCPEGKTIIRIEQEWNKWDDVELSFENLRQIFQKREEVFS